ncbi:MAG TPA: apolipoprotein N-acyltransferase [Steroidobacteraceae bacterium]|nr:apolipoprotein N-acyltransferase [Steroidobacteraceae bacterium]
MLLRDQPALRLAAAALSGALLSAAFAPFGQWWLALACPALLMALLRGASPARAAALGFWFNAGTFTAGTYWLYISIHEIGHAPLWVAFLPMAGLIGVMSLYGALLGFVTARFLPPQGALRHLVGLPAAWVLIEWWRGWFLTGFPWLSLGYSQTDTVLRHAAPVVGVYGLSALLLVGAGALVLLVVGNSRERLLAAVVLAVSWLAPWSLRSIEWTHPAGPPVVVAVAQGAIPEDEKWQEDNRQPTLDRYRDLTRRALGQGAAVIVWPEAAAPDTAQNLQDYLLDMYHEVHARGAALVLGVLRETPGGDYYNSILTMGKEVAWYDKRHLVPFAETFPVPDFVANWLRLLDLPYSGFRRGAEHQPPLPAGGLELAATICYDDAYGSDDLRALATATALVTVTNDGWFGRSTARYQHLQIARMRAIEAGRYLIRAANDGISAVIGPDGQVLAQAPSYSPQVLRAQVTPRSGLPPYARTGNWLIILLAATSLGVAVRARGGTPGAAAGSIHVSWSFLKRRSRK